jgi:transcriptional regulator with XRE-family HTH domain
VTKPRKKSTKPSAYDTPTPEKKAYGARLKLARETQGLTQIDAAHMLGYTQAVHLSNMENGNRLPPLHVLIQCANLYGTTLDFLCGLSEEVDRDPAVAIQRMLTASTRSSFDRLIAEVTARSVEVARKLLPSASAGERIAQAGLEAATALSRLEELNPKAWENLKGGSNAQAKSAALRSSCTEYLESMLRARRVMSAKTQGEAMVAAAGQPIAQLQLIATEEC